jgi:hypothetical protein
MTARRFIRKINQFTIAGMCLISVLTVARAQDNPVKIRLNSAGIVQNSAYRVEKSAGFGFSGQFNRRLTKNFDITLRVGYNTHYLTQDSVLDEWNWDYWDLRYTDYLDNLGTFTKKNGKLHYTKNDTTFLADFDPRQTLGETMLSLGLEYHKDLTKNIRFYTDCNFGVNVYRRNIKMVEDWTKTFHWDTTSTAMKTNLELLREVFGLDSSTVEYDYEYQIQITHFAPPKKGKLFFVSPTVGMRFYLSPSMDLDVAYQFIYYFDGGKLGNMFGFSKNSYRWYPLKSTSQLTFGITFKY